MKRNIHTKKLLFTIGTTVLFSASMIFTFTSCSKSDSHYVKVGLLHSLTGAMALSETPVRDAELLAINEINKNGGVLGHQIKVIQEDGKSTPTKFAEKARKLLETDKVTTVFGCWTSNSRKAVKPIFEENYKLLWYPVQYEGMEASPNIMYTGASPNQQVVPAIDWAAETLGKKFFLIGSDYTFPRIANRIIKTQAKHIGAEIIGEIYVSMDKSDFSSIIKEIKNAKPDVIINTINGNSNISFFQQLKQYGIKAADIPVLSFSVSEGEVNSIGIENLANHYIAWNYFESTETKENTEFIKNYKNAYGQDRKLGDPIEAAYVAVHLWAKACEKAGTFDTEAVRIAAKGLSFQAPEGLATIEGSNQHLYKTVRIGKISKNGHVDQVWATPAPVRPDPYLSTYAWARGL